MRLIGSSDWISIQRAGCWGLAVDAIVAESLTRRYGRRTGIEELNLVVREGVLSGFLGPNGAGKTTTIRVLLGFLRPTSGRASLFGLDCWQRSHRAKAEVGYLPGDLRLHPWMDGRQALRLFGAIRRRDLMVEGRRLAEEFNLDLRVKARQMSRGMRQKLGLILAMAHRPRLLILDEPTTALDPLMQEQLHGHLRELAAAGHTVFFSSHTLSEVEQLCDRVAIVREGRVIVDAGLDELRGRSRREVMIRWKGVAQAEQVPPPFLEVRRRDGQTWSCLLAGSPEDLLQWAAGRPIEDFSVGRPDLDTLFRGYYRQGG
ncbi:MAG: ABC transporter ATP-binding protein [Phycisphaerae bacterium]|nr:ABC transporter ATP-binding protein [Phycisphaerae bacterium]